MIEAAVKPVVKTGGDLRGLNHSLGFLLRVSQLKVFDHFFKKLGHVGLKPGEYSVLWLIFNNPRIRQGLAAQTLSIKNAHMTKLIRSFEESGFVTRTIPDGDRRAVELDLTVSGRDFVTFHQQEFFGYIQSLNSPLNDAETKELIRLLAKFACVDQELTK
ncbi:MarR family winged helix-turn-helix transcriptional regulator [Roseibium algae]|uniref:MarR family transcriptional regulator n=1 Tax=Roseibium algae TaxID=3123038 RepID=A0ABU8TN75_9HYPH